MPHEALHRSFERAVIIAVAAVRMVQMAVDQVVNMVGMRHTLVSAAGTVHVAALMPSARVIRRALRPVRAVVFQDVLIHVVAMDVMQMTVVHVVRVAVVLDGCVTAPRPVRVRMLFVFLAGHIAPLSESLNNRSIQQFAC